MAIGRDASPALDKDGKSGVDATLSEKGVLEPSRHEEGDDSCSIAFVEAYEEEEEEEGW